MLEWIGLAHRKTMELFNIYNNHGVLVFLLASNHASSFNYQPWEMGSTNKRAYLWVGLTSGPYFVFSNIIFSFNI